jgi:hypothetical protein
MPDGRLRRPCRDALEPNSVAGAHDGFGDEVAELADRERAREMVALPEPATQEPQPSTWSGCSIPSATMSRPNASRSATIARVSDVFSNGAAAIALRDLDCTDTTNLAEMLTGAEPSAGSRIVKRFS